MASEVLEETGLSVRHEVNAATFAQLEEELARPMGRSDLVPIYMSGSQALGPAAHDMRVTLGVATGSFARTAAHGTTVFTELAPRVPVTIVESDRPITL